MESGYSFIELAGMHLVLGESKGDATYTVRKYERKIPYQKSGKSLCYPFC
jgi:hypothetical protein